MNISCALTTRAGVLIAVLASLAGCSDSPSSGAAPAAGQTSAPLVAEDSSRREQGAAASAAPAELEMPAGVIVAHPRSNADRSAYFGDLHVHTDYSFDAFAFGTVATPYDAYRYAQGEAILHPAGFEVKLREPLDFYAVTDHAMFLGAAKAAADPSTAFSKFLEAIPCKATAICCPCFCPGAS